MKICTPVLLLLILLSCQNNKDFKSQFEKQRFDLTVMNNLPLYDTLLQLILSNFSRFDLSNTKNNFTYIYNFDAATQIGEYNNHDIPEIIYSQTEQLFNRLGKDNIFGFTISKDSTFEILIRNTPLAKYYLDVRERLYWSPKASKIQKPAFPMKDTLLNGKWQYLIWYDKRTEF